MLSYDQRLLAADNGADKLKAPDELALSHTLRWTDLVSKDIDELQADSDSDSDSETESENDDSEDDEFDDEHALRRSPSRMPALIKSSAVRTAEQRPHLDHTIDRTAIPRRPRRVQTLEPIEEQASQDEILRDHESITAAYFRLEDKQAPPSRIHQLPSAIVEMVPSVLDPTVGESSSLPRIAAVG